MSLAKARAGAQPGNLNGSRHPWRAFWKRRALRPADRWVLALVENYEAGIEEDRGEISFAAARVIEIAKTAKVCSMLAMDAFAPTGILLESGEVHAAFKELPKFLTLELNALKSLGLEKKTREPLSLKDYVAQSYPKGTTRKE